MTLVDVGVKLVMQTVAHVTVIAAVPDFVLSYTDVAVIVTGPPADTPVTTPAALTVAFDGSLLDQATAVEAPPTTVTFAVSATVWPMATVAVAGVTATLVAAPPVAVNVALPPAAVGSRLLAVTTSVFVPPAVPRVQLGHVYVPLGLSTATPVPATLPPPPVTVHVTVAPPTTVLP